MTWELSICGKIPCRGYTLPVPKGCPKGKKLVGTEGTICHRCYAKKFQENPRTTGNSGNQEAYQARLEAILHPGWVDMMVERILADLLSREKAEPYFRFHEGGDVQDVAHFGKIVDVARILRHVPMWLPTKEWETVLAWREKHGPWPDNLIVRFTALMIDGPPPMKYYRALKIPVETVSGRGPCRWPEAFRCPVLDADRIESVGFNCGDCRRCWDPERYPWIDHPLHH